MWRSNQRVGLDHPVTPKGFHDEIRWDSNKPEGQPRRCLDVSKGGARVRLPPSNGFWQGLLKTINWYRERYAKL
jgi:GDP-L-fucose synthase